mmetsp:Transcript_13982/g.37168  ORF Transcript_13982/g.37168 Transcript_13982/m.37168 type:complete len:343 (-) Transcript_13982:313-1341(-)
MVGKSALPHALMRCISLEGGCATRPVNITDREVQRWTHEADESAERQKGERGSGSEEQPGASCTPWGPPRGLRRRGRGSGVVLVLGDLQGAVDDAVLVLHDDLGLVEHVLVLVILDVEVRGHRDLARAQGPHMAAVDIDHALDVRQIIEYRVALQLWRCALHQHRHQLLENAESAEGHRGRVEQSTQGVQPRSLRIRPHDGPDRRADSALEEVGYHVQASHALCGAVARAVAVAVAMARVQAQQHDVRADGHQCGQADHQAVHPVPHVRALGESPDRLGDHQGGDEVLQQQGHESTQHLRAVVAERIIRGVPLVLRQYGRTQQAGIEKHVGQLVGAVAVERQ